MNKTPIQSPGRVRLAWFTLGVVLAAVSAIHADKTTCNVTAASFASLQGCVNQAAAAGDTSRTDTTIVVVPAGLYNGNAAKSQLRINRRKNLWIIGDTINVSTEKKLPRILYQDTNHVYTDLDSGKRADTSSSGRYGQNNGTVWIYRSDNIRLVGLLVDGNRTTATTNTTGRIFAYGATLGKSAPVEIRGNVGVNILESRNVQLRYLSVTNAWNGISIISPNFGGAFAFPDPNDPIQEVVRTLPTSQAGLYGNHLIERCRIHDNVFGILFQRDWDLSSVVRNNLFWGNYLRHWGDSRTPNSYTVNLQTLDNTTRADGSKRSLAYTTVGGAFLMTDVALTPYRIHNNTFFNNATIFSGYYKTGTQHLFYNNLVGRPYQFFRSAVDLPVQDNSNGAYTSFQYGYTQTERQTEMLQFMSEHQRANRVVDQDSIPANKAVAMDLWSSSGGNLRLYNMRQSRTNTGNWLGGGPTGSEPGRSWSNDQGVQDSVTMSWVPDYSSTGTLGAIADTGGIVGWIRHNMWTGSAKDSTMDPNVGANWCPPWVPRQIRSKLSDPTVFRNTSGFDVRWTFGLPVDTLSDSSDTWLRPQTSSKIGLSGWETYEGSPSHPLSIGAYNADGHWAAPERRLVLRDTLIESVTDSMVKFRLNVSGQGISDTEIVKLEVASAKFYNDVPVADTLYNQGLNAAGTGTTTRVNSILSSKPWPLPYQFQKADYDRPGYNVDDSLTKRRLDADNVFLGRIGSAYRLPSDSLYARAEVVLKATLSDGSVVFSNPGVFMFSRPRYQFTVTVTDTFGKPLPLDEDGISQDVIAGQPFRVVVKTKVLAKLPVSFQGYANLQIGGLGTLTGVEGDKFFRWVPSVGGWVVTRNNDTVASKFLKQDSVRANYHAMESPAWGSLKYQAVFVDTMGGLLPYYIQGTSNPIRVVSGSIYQVTIDSVLRDTNVLATPKLGLKLLLNRDSSGRRDTILTVGSDTSLNISSAVHDDTLRVVMQVRDRFGNPVIGRDSTSEKKGIFIELAHVLSMRAGATANPRFLRVDTGFSWHDSVRVSFDSAGRAVAKVLVSPNFNSSSLAALRASLVDSLGREFGQGASRDSGVVDTTWIRTFLTTSGLVWADSSGRSILSPIDGWVGSWYPVRVKMLQDGKGTIFTGPLSLLTALPLRYHPAEGDTTTVTSAFFSGDSLSKVLWVRADDSTSLGWILASAGGSQDSLGGLRFRYPTIRSAAFFDRDCDGKVDSLSAWISGPLAFRTAGAIEGDTLDAVFPHQILSPSAKVAPSRASFTDSTLGLSWSPASANPASKANRIVLWNPLAAKSVTLSIASLTDKTIPVIVGAWDYQTWTAEGAKDSLVVDFSEPIDVSGFLAGSDVPFRAWRGGSAVALAGANLLSPVVQLDTARYAFVFSGPAGSIVKGDSIQGIPGAIADRFGNSNAAGCNTPGRVVVVPRFTPLPGWVKDYDGDGNADSVHLAFQDSIGTLPEQILVRWGSPAETMTVFRSQLIAAGVKTSDTSFTLPTHNWKGQTIVVDGDTVRNAPRTTGPWDSAWFNGGIQRAFLRDLVPPVVIHARLHYGPAPAIGSQGFDTLVVNFSEPVRGCEVGGNPAQCLSQSGVSSDGVFPAGSKIASATGDRWVILVPQGSITPYVSKVRGLPSSSGGVLSDVGANSTGGGAAWVPVQGDPPPPDHGWMLDRNGDGRVDAVLLQFRSVFRGQSLPSYSFEWSSAAGAATNLLASHSSRFTDATHADSTWWIATLDVPGDFGATSYPPIYQRMTGLQNSSTPYRFWIYDSVGSVLKSPAILQPSKDSLGNDTLVVIPSEPLASPTGSVLLEFKRGATAIDPGKVVFVSAQPLADGSWKVILGPGAYRPNPGDSVRLSTSGSVRDVTPSANVPDSRHPWIVLTGYLRSPYAAYYEDSTKDGRIDRVFLRFAVPPVVGSIVLVQDPAGSGKTRQFVVPASDSSSTDIAFDFSGDPWGQNVTSWTNSDLGTLVAPAGVDTSLLKGTRFPILDRVEPVIVSATMRYTSDTGLVDTLTLVLSEGVVIDTGRILLESKRAGSAANGGDPTYPLYVHYDPAKHVLTLYLKPVPASQDTINPAVDDSVRLTDYIKDLSGNRPSTIAKWTEVTGNRRVFPPKPTLSNPMITPASGQSGDVVGDGSGTLDVVIRPSAPGNIGDWWKFDPRSGSSSSTGSSYRPGAPDYGSVGQQGTVFFVQTNVPVKLSLYIYDLVGTFVSTQVLDVSQEMIDKANHSISTTGQGSKVGMVDVGMLWKGQDATGHLVGAGIYLARLIAYRDPTPEEKTAGQTNCLMYNHLAKVGVRSGLH